MRKDKKILFILFEFKKISFLHPPTEAVKKVPLNNSPLNPLRGLIDYQIFINPL